MSVKITYQDPPKSSEIGRHIESYTSYYFTDTDTIRFFPEGRFELLFQMDAQFLHRSHKDLTWVNRPSAFVGGLHDRAYHVKPISKTTSCIGIKFKPDSAKYFIPKKLNTLKNRVVSVTDIWNDEGRKLIEKISAAKDQPICFHYIEEFLSRQFRPGKFRSFERTCSDIQHKRMNLSVQEMASETRLSSAHFRKIFLEHIGISPCEFRKITRVKLAREKLNQHQFQSLTDLAFDLGYFDQSHFIREFKSITCLTPGQFHSEVS